MLEVIDTETGETIFELPEAARHTGEIEYCDVEENGTWAVTIAGDQDHSIRVWDLTNRSLRAVIPRSSGRSLGLVILQGEGAFVRAEAPSNASPTPKLVKHSTDGDILATQPIERVPGTPLHYDARLKRVSFAWKDVTGSPFVVQCDDSLRLSPKCGIGDESEFITVRNVQSSGPSSVLTWESTQQNSTHENKRYPCEVLRERLLKDGRITRQWFLEHTWNPTIPSVAGTADTIAVGTNTRFRLFDGCTGTVLSDESEFFGNDECLGVFLCPETRRAFWFSESRVMIWQLVPATVDQELQSAANSESATIEQIQTLSKPGTQLRGLMKRHGIGEAEFIIEGLGGKPASILAAIRFHRIHPRGCPVDENVRTFECSIVTGADKRTKLVIGIVKNPVPRSPNLILDESIQSQTLILRSRKDSHIFESEDGSLSVEIFRP